MLTILQLGNDRLADESLRLGTVRCPDLPDQHLLAQEIDDALGNLEQRAAINSAE